MRGESAALFGNKLRKQIRFAGGDEFLHLLFRNFAMQNIFADTEGARLRRSDGILTRVRSFQDIDLPFLTDRTEPERLMAFLVDLLFGVHPVLAKIELLLELATEFHGGVELPPHFAAKSFQRPDASFAQ